MSEESLMRCEWSVRVAWLVAACCALSGLTACTAERGVAFSNRTTGKVTVWHQFDGQKPVLLAPTMPPLDSGEWRGDLFNKGAPRCEASSRLIAETEQGKRYTFGPPLCRDQLWLITDPTPTPTRTPAAGSTSNTTPTP
jgi:hypothetical protein